MRRQLVAAIVCAGVFGGSPAAATGAGAPTPLTAEHFRAVRAAEAELGRLLFYDKLLSGNRNVSCGDCHNHDFAGGDDVSLGFGEGGAGLGRARSEGAGADRVEHRVPRNAPALFNLGVTDLRTLLYDGRVARDPSRPSGVETPFDAATPEGLDGVLAAQALAPLLSRVEMAGAPEENDVALWAQRRRYAEAWEEIVARLRAVPEYAALFAAAYPETVRAPEDVTIVEVANALAAFIGQEWRADATPFDRLMRGEIEALPSPAAARGMDLFFGRAGCAACHGGALLTDQGFHAIAMPQIGPGKTLFFEGLATDQGRLLETGDLADAYRFRTPALRNVAWTAPYGHSGAYAALEDVVRHHLDPLKAFDAYAPEQARLPGSARLGEKDFLAMQDEAERAAIRRANALAPVALSEPEIADLLAFLREALTDEAALEGRLGKPAAVPSGLPVD